MKSQKKHFYVVIGIGIAFLIIALICGVVGYLRNMTELYLVAVLGGLIGFILLIVGLSKLFNSKKIAKNMENPNSLSSKTYGKGAPYTHFVCYLDKKGQRAQNIAVNTLGVLGAVFGAGGVFVTGQNSYDVFVSDKELVLNSQVENPTYDDKKFKIVPSTNMKDMQFERVKGHERVIISFKTSNKTLCLDVVAQNDEQANVVKETFNKMLGENKE